jgi:hypothetical protein
MLQLNDLHEIYRLCDESLHSSPSAPLELIKQYITLDLLCTMPETTQAYIKDLCRSGSSEVELMKYNSCHENHFVCQEIKKCSLSHTFSHIPVLCNYNNCGYNDDQGYDFISLIKEYVLEMAHIDTSYIEGSKNNTCTKVNFTTILPDGKTCKSMSIARDKNMSGLTNHICNLKQEIRKLQQKYSDLSVQFNALGEQKKEQPSIKDEERPKARTNLHM